MKYFLPFIFSLFVFSGISLYAQEKYTPGELMIQFKQSSKTQNEIIHEFKQDFSELNFQEKRQLSRRKQIWLFTFDQTKSPDQKVLNSVRGYYLVDLAQFNHQLSSRELEEYFPNDQYFDDLWGLHNTGQNGGLEDADIDAPEAWGITTSGLTALGDTIVIAVVDKGVDVEHEDLNMWRNYDEIPGNGIDDDNNGYVDDFRGWNAYDDSDELPFNSHGTHVAGITAAIGDNEIGVTGVCYNAQIMGVAASSTWEATVVEGLSYILEMRTRYNETNGEQGAFVVVTNESFGVDYGNADDYPIWEDMYNSLGEQGVLSTAATVNADRNVDVVHDVPTNFTTDFMIAVTNTKRNDVKHTLAGYGRKSIDLGAPGSTIYSTIPGSTYANKSGCSMAAPHVAGTIALMYANADEELLETYKEYPDSVAIMMRKYILYNSDYNESLEGITVTSRRLNLYKSLLAMDEPIVDPYLIPQDEKIMHFMAVDEVDTVAFQVSNGGQGTLNYSLIFNMNAPWLSAVNPLGTAFEEGADIAQLIFDSSDLEEGNYETIMKIATESDTTDILVLLEVDVLDANGTKQQSNVQINAYPNPFNNEVSIELEGNVRNQSKLQIYNLTGNIILEEEFQGKSYIWDGAYKGQPVTPGVYFVKVTSDGFHLTKKIVKQ